MFLDASAVVAVLTDEGDVADILNELTHASSTFFFSGMSKWESAVAIARIKNIPNEQAAGFLQSWYSDIGAQCVPIDENISMIALLAHSKYGKGSGHRARLNMGDCFAYACAKSLGIPLLYIGNDFSHTDLTLN